MGDTISHSNLTHLGSQDYMYFMHKAFRVFRRIEALLSRSIANHAYSLRVNTNELRKFWCTSAHNYEKVYIAITFLREKSFQLQQNIAFWTLTDFNHTHFHSNFSVAIAITI